MCKGKRNVNAVPVRRSERIRRRMENVVIVRRRSERIRRRMEHQVVIRRRSHRLSRLQKAEAKKKKYDINELINAATPRNTHSMEMIEEIRKLMMEIGNGITMQEDAQKVLAERAEEKIVERCNSRDNYNEPIGSYFV